VPLRVGISLISPRKLTHSIQSASAIEPTIATVTPAKLITFVMAVSSESLLASGELHDGNQFPEHCKGEAYGLAAKPPFVPRETQCGGSYSAA
jgi:hypothetical protein